LRPAEQRGGHLARLVGVVIDRLLAHDHQLRLFLVDNRLDQLGHGQRLHFAGNLDEDAAVGAHRHRRAQSFLRLLRTDGNYNDFGHNAGFLHAHRLFNRDFAEGIHRHLDVGGLHASAIRLDAHLHVRVDDTFDCH